MAYFQIKHYAILVSATLLYISCVNGQNSVTLTQSEAKEDLNWLKYSLEYVHPRLYKYDDKKIVDRRFNHAINSMNDSISGIDFLSVVSKLNASVNCGHLYTIPQGNLREEILQKKVMPFYVKVVGSNLYVFNDCSEKDPIPNGSKIISINGNLSSEIYNSITDGIATDGFIETRKKRLIERYFSNSHHGFDLYYHLHVDRSETFEIEYQEFQSKDQKKKNLEGISIDERKELLLKKYGLDQDVWFKTPSPRFELNKDKDYAVLTISRSFYDRKIDPDYDSLLSQAFFQLKKESIGHLIVDLRNNEGGSEHQQMELMSYLYDEPFKLYQNIYQSHIDFRPLKQIIIERDTSQLLFNNDDEYMRRFSKNLWINNYEYDKNLQLQHPKPNSFKGKLYVLINGITFSSAADLAADIKKTTDATFIGEESGGTFEGLTGGISIVVQLPNSKIMVRISPNIQIGYMYQKHPIGKGVLPNYEIIYNVDDHLSKRDLEMEKAIELILNTPK